MSDDVTNQLLRELIAVAKSIDAKLGKPPATARTATLGRVFALGQLVPDDVDLVIATGGLRWIRDPNDTDRWWPRDVEGPIISTNELLSRVGQITEIPAPAEQANR